MSAWRERRFPLQKGLHLRTRRVVVRLKGGLGNQMFQYAAGFALASRLNARLILDTRSGFSRDWQYRREYALEPFGLSACIPQTSKWSAKALELLPLYGMASKLRSTVPGTELFEQRQNKFDFSLLNAEPRRRIILDGYWQSERYFEDCGAELRSEFQLKAPKSAHFHQYAEKIAHEPHAVAIHFRQFDGNWPGGLNTVDGSYYEKAVGQILTSVPVPHFFVFTDAAHLPNLPAAIMDHGFTAITRREAPKSAAENLVLMSMCHDFIIANSTFSWWAAWLGEGEDSLIFSPYHPGSGSVTAWNMDELIPDRWSVLPN